jgi:hypothetical protein
MGSSWPGHSDPDIHLHLEVLFKILLIFNGGSPNAFHGQISSAAYVRKCHGNSEIPPDLTHPPARYETESFLCKDSAISLGILDDHTLSIEMPVVL